MKLINLVTYLRENILYDVGGTGVDWSSISSSDYDSIQLRWTNEELVGYINEAITLVYRRTNPIKDLIQLPVVSNNNLIVLPKSVSEVLKVKDSSGLSLTEKSIDDFWEMKDLNSSTGKPLYFFTDYTQGKIRVHPTPVADDTLDLMVYRYPLSQLSWKSINVSPELREEYQIPMLYGAASFAYLKDEANVYDPTRASELMSRFDREFPFTSVYSNIRKGRTANRPVSYGGVHSSRSLQRSRTTAKVFY